MLFCILSLLLHLGVLVAFAGSIKMQRISSENMENKDPIQVSTVRMPPPAPESPPPEPETPPSQTPPRAPTAPDALSRPRPVVTPTPRPTPLLAKPSPSPSGALASPTPTPLVSPTPSASPAPTLSSPTPQPSPSENLAPAEAQAKQSIQDFMKAQGTEVPDKLPQGFKSWEDYQKFLISFDENAARLMVLPGNTAGSEQASSAPASGATPAPGQVPTDNSGSGNSGGGGWFDWVKNEKQPQAFDTREADRQLEATRQRLNDLTRPLELPEASPPPLPEKWETGSLGFSYVNFKYEQLQFRARWDSAVQEDVREVDVSYYPPAAPKDVQTFKLKWQPAWTQDIRGLISAIQIAYTQQLKKTQP